MWAALLTACLWSWSGISSARAGRALGVITVNRSRLAVSCLLLVCLTWALDRWQVGGIGWFFASGVVGLGMGDIAMYASYRHLGARLTILITQALAVPCAWLVESLWLGTPITLHEVGWSFVILVGLALALLPGRHDGPPAAGSRRRLGIGLGIVSAVSLAASAVLSRRGYAVVGEAADGLSAATLRNLAGFASMVLIWPLQLAMVRSRRRLGSPVPAPDWRHGIWWMLSSALAGPCIGVVCYQTALASSPAGTVQAVVATTPVLIMPLTWMIDGDKPKPLSVVGALVAVGGVMGLVL